MSEQQTALQAAGPFLEFRCQAQRFAVPLSCVRRAIPGARPVPLPGAADIVLGLLNMHGETVTVLDFARRAGLAPTAITAAQYLLLVELNSFACALVVDAIGGLVDAGELAAAWPAAADSAPFVAGVLQVPDGLCVVIDPARFLFEHEQAQLADILAGRSIEGH